MAQASRRRAKAAMSAVRCGGRARECGSRGAVTFMNRILVVDDDKIVLKYVEKAFPRDTVNMAFAMTGEEALIVAKAFRPDLVILDIMLPGEIDGYEVCRRIKSSNSTAGAMVLLLSGKTSLESRLRGYEALADDYMIKPFDIEELAAKAGILLRLKTAVNELESVNRNLTALVESRTRELMRKEHLAIIGQLVQGLAHNIGGPLTIIQARAELTASILRNPSPEVSDEKEDQEDEDLLDQLARNQELILEAAQRVGELVENLLEKSRNEAFLREQQIDLNELVRRELEFLEADPNVARRVTKRFLPAEKMPTISGVYADFSQVVYNLVVNATDAMEKSPRRELEISTGFDEETVFMAFTDSGEGISPDIQDRIFERFFTTKSDSNGQRGGSGLGLYTCRQLMKPYGATIFAENVPAGGSRFTVTIPRRPPSRERG
jgi:signal transduction histidine kinase